MMDKDAEHLIIPIRGDGRNISHRLVMYIYNMISSILRSENMSDKRNIFYGQQLKLLKT